MLPPYPKIAVHHAVKVKARMLRLVNHLRNDVGKVTEPEAQGLFEASAQVLAGLVKAFDNYELKVDAAWNTEPLVDFSRKRKSNATRRCQ